MNDFQYACHRDHEGGLHFKIEFGPAETYIDLTPAEVSAFIVWLEDHGVIAYSDEDTSRIGDRSQLLAVIQELCEHIKRTCTPIGGREMQEALNYVAGITAATT